MAVVAISDSILTDIADAIRSKNGTENTYKPAQMPDAIEAISGGITPTGTKQISITQNGTTIEDVTNYASAEITVNVPTGGGSSLPKTGTITPEARTTSMTIDLGDSSISSVNGVVIAPTDSTPLLSGGKTCSVLLALPGLFYQSVAVVSNNAGSGYGVAPSMSTSDDRISISDGVITVTAPNAFEAISYTWYVW